MKKKSFVVITILLSLVILGLCAFIAYDKNVFNIKGEADKQKEKIEEKKEEKESEDETKAIDINSDIVKNLIYPNMAADIININIPVAFVLANVSPDDYSRDSKMIAAQFLDYDLEGERKDYVCTYSTDEKGKTVINGVVREENQGELKDNEGWCVAYPNTSIKSNYIKLFGPDSDYEDASVSSTGCGFINYYDKNTDNYYANTGCGGAYPGYGSVRKTYKAETKGENLYIYDYAMIIYEHDSVNGIALFKDYTSFHKFEETDSVNYAKYIVQTKTDAKTKLEEGINNNTVNTYVWTFKKQSDGKYYYHSSKWLEN